MIAGDEVLQNWMSHSLHVLQKPLIRQHIIRSERHSGAQVRSEWGLIMKAVSPDWVRLRTEFLNDPEDGIRFWKTLNDLTRYVVEPMCGASQSDINQWDGVINSPQFHAAFEFVTDRLLSPDGFRNVMEKYKASGSALSPWAYMTNRVRYVLTEWRTIRRDQPSRKIVNDEHIENRAAAGDDSSSDVNRGERDSTGSFRMMEQRIDALSAGQQAVLMLSLWPQETMPSHWRLKYLPVILEVGERNQQTRTKTAKRLEEVDRKLSGVAANESKSQDAAKEPDPIAELYAKQIIHFESQRHFDIQKRKMVQRLCEFSLDGSWNESTDIVGLLRCDCYVAVKKTSEDAVLRLFDNENVYHQPTTGRRKVKDRPMWCRRRFSQCCYKQKYHRRVWLNASAELASKKPVDGAMPHADIAYILNAKVGTCFSDLSRARAKLASLNPEDDTTDLNPLEEPDDLKLQRSVCEDLSPQAG